ncbi:MAG: hypothetical protein J5507_04465 [Clostridia bacterium]|nr:hypothetical protein [Clostridia bacterium]
MKTSFIKEMDNNIGFIKKILVLIKRCINIINVENYNENIIYLLPIYNKKKNRNHQINRISKTILKKLEKDRTNKVVLSEYLKGIEALKNNLYSNNINILDGRFLFKCLSKNIIEYILKQNSSKIENSEICIILNDFTNINKNIIIDVAKSAKNVNIITNNISKCNKLENYLYNEYGILLNVSNNKKTSLLKSKIILNLDFPEELINKYKINTKAIIINTQEKIEIHSKKFNGINLNYFKINIPDKYKIEGFSYEETYESMIYNSSYGDVQEKIEKDKIEIKGLIGNRGIISKHEFLG